MNLQQDLHDTFVDTSWPTCPEHGLHPMWVDLWTELDGPDEINWRCPSNPSLAIPLGALPPPDA